MFSKIPIFIFPNIIKLGPSRSRDAHLCFNTLKLNHHVRDSDPDLLPDLNLNPWTLKPRLRYTNLSISDLTRKQEPLNCRELSVSRHTKRKIPEQTHSVVLQSTPNSLIFNLTVTTAWCTHGYADKTWYCAHTDVCGIWSTSVMPWGLRLSSHFMWKHVVFCFFGKVLRLHVNILKTMSIYTKTLKTLDLAEQRHIDVCMDRRLSWKWGLISSRGCHMSHLVFQRTCFPGNIEHTGL